MTPSASIAPPRPSSPASSHPPARPVSISEASPFLSDDSNDAAPPSAITPASSNPADIWSTILRSIADRHSLSWVQSLSLARLDERTAVVALLPGKRDMHRFVSAERQREQLAELFRKALGRPVRIEVESTGGPQSNGAGHGTASPGHSPNSNGSAPSTQSIRTEREQALALPLVKEVLTVFEATLVETHLEGKAEPAPVAVLPAVEPAASSPPAQPGFDVIDPPDVDPMMDMED